MKSGTKIFLIFGGIFGGLVLLMIIVVVGFMGSKMLGLDSATARSRENYKKQTSETVGTITDVSLSSMSKTYTYTYIVNGTTYSRTYSASRNKVENNPREKVGKKGQVCYDPSDPSSSGFWNHEVFLDQGNKVTCGGTSK